MKEGKVQRESFVAYRSFEKKKLPDSQRLQYYDALFAYGLRQEQPDFKGDVWLESIWESVTPQIDANLQRYINGLKGGDFGKLGGNPNFQKGKPNPYYQDNPKDNPKITPNENVNANENLFDSVDAGAPTPKRKKFVKPTLEEVRAYCESRGNNVDAGRFINFYESVGWRVGKSPMKDWQAAVRTWERNERQGTSTSQQPTQGRRITCVDDIWEK